MAKTPGDANTLTAPSDRRRLPIGIQTFREIREGGYYYVDKTAALGRLVDGGKHCRDRAASARACSSIR